MKDKPEMPLLEMRRRTHDAMALINKLRQSFPDSGEKNVGIVIMTCIKDAYDQGVNDALLYKNQS